MDRPSMTGRPASRSQPEPHTLNLPSRLAALHPRPAGTASMPLGPEPHVPDQSTATAARTVTGTPTAARVFRHKTQPLRGRVGELVSASTGRSGRPH